jgi:phospholipase C
VWGEPLEICAGPYETEVPLTDPDHDFAGVTYQIFRKWNVTNDDVPNMAGFVERQSEKYSATPGDASFVIKAYSQEKTAVLAELAKNFAFFDTYVCFCSSFRVNLAN